MSAIVTFKNPFGEFHEFSEKRVGYIRADYDKGRWWNSIFKESECSADMEKEFDELYDLITGRFPSLDVLEEFCRSESRLEKVSDTEFNLYAEGYGVYWIRFHLDCDGYHDYNVYIYGYNKEDIRV